MARPITWQDVAAPSQGAALAASQAAGDSIRNALSGLSNTVTGFQDAVKKDATNKVVADVMASADPLAAAAAAPQGWQVDPLAVAAAAQNTDARLRANAASDASLAASKVSTALNNATLQDKESDRVATSLSSPVIDQIVKTGKLPSIDLNDAQWKTEGGNKAYAQVLQFKRDYDADQRATLALHWQRKQAIRDEANQNYLNWEAERGATPEFQQADPAAARAESLKMARKFGADLTKVDQGLSFAVNSAVNSKPTEAQLDGQVPNISPAKDSKGNNRPATTYLDVQATLRGRVSDLETQKAAEEAKYQAAVQGRDLMAQNAFKGPVELIPNQIAKTLGWSEGDAREALDAVRAEYKDLDAAQAADIVLASKGKWFEGFAARSDEAKAIAGRYKAFNDGGREKGLQRNLDSITSKFDRQITRAQQLGLQVNGAARAGAPVPTEAANWVEQYRQNQLNQEKANDAAEAKRIADQRAAAEEAARAQKSTQEALQRAFERH
jgi:hypothetical protein